MDFTFFSVHSSLLLIATVAEMSDKENQLLLIFGKGRDKFVLVILIFCFETPKQVRVFENQKAK